MADSIKLKHFNKQAEACDWRGILEVLDIGKGARIADIGAGGGFFSMKFAEETGHEGRVFAQDINNAHLDYISRQISGKPEYANIVTVEGTEEAINLPEKDFDLIFLRNVFHHIKDKEDFIKSLWGFIKSGGTLAVIDHKKGFGPHPGGRHGTPSGEIDDILKSTGFSMIRAYDFLQGYWFFTGIKS